MANTSAILLALMVVATALMVVPTASVALGGTVNGINAAKMNIAADLKSLVAGKPDPVGLTGVNVSVTCNKTTLAQVTADREGRIAVNVNLTDATIIDIPQCIVKLVTLDRTLAVTPPNGTIQAKLIVNGAETIPGVGLTLYAGITASE